MRQARMFQALGLLAAVLPSLAGAGTGPAGPSVPAPGHGLSQTITLDQFHNVILAHVQEQLGTLGTVQVEILDPQEPLQVPAGTATLRVVSGGPEDGLGRRLFRIAVAVNGQERERIKVATDVSVLADLVTAVRALRPDEVIESEDVELSAIRLRTARHDFLSTVDAAVGKRVIKPLSAGSPVRASALTVPYSVKKGDRVTIEARRGGVYIQTSGVTKSGAQLGQVVAVTNQDSGREIRGRVVGPGLVRVDF